MAKKQKEEAIAFDEQLSKSEAFIEKNLKVIIIALVAVIVVVSGVFIYNNHMADVEQQAQKAIAKSQTAFAQSQYDQALNGDGASSKGFLKIINDYSGTKTANLAKLYAALCYANTEKYAEAIKMFEDFDRKDDQMISPASLGALGNCYIKNGQNEKGAEMLVKAAKSADNNALSPLFLLQAGEVYESLNNNEKAVELYKEIKSKYFRSPVSLNIDKYIERTTK